METPSTPQQTPDGGGRSPSAAPPPVVLGPVHGSGYSRACPSTGCRWHLHGRVLSEILEAYEIHWGVKHSDATRSPRAAGGFVSGPQPVLIGEKDGPWLSLADHVELARGKTPEWMLDRGLEEAIDAAYADGSIFSPANRDPADVHSDDVMLSAVGCSEPHLGLATTGQLLDEIRARIEMGHGGLNYTTVGGN